VTALACQLWICSNGRGLQSPPQPRRTCEKRRAPNLGGQTEDYLVELMMAFKSGECGHEMMSVVVQSLSPTDIEDLAAYYSAIEISVGKLPAQ
jgi:cytochrome c553